MANPYGNPNPNIAELGKKTHFGSGQDPNAYRNKTKPWEIRNALRRLMLLEINPGENVTLDKLCEVFGGKDRISLAQLAACKKYQQALQHGKFMDTLIEHVDGPQVQMKMEANVSLAEMIVEAQRGRITNQQPGEEPEQSGGGSADDLAE